MRKAVFALVISVLFSFSHRISGQRVLVECERFEERGGWVIDQQSMEAMGSPYLMAHGMGELVEDAYTRIRIPNKGKYHVYVRTRNWTAPWSDVPAGTFQVLVDGIKLDPVFGKGKSAWGWSYGGKVKLGTGEHELRLHDLSGFNGRCDAIYLTSSRKDVLPNDKEGMEKLDVLLNQVDPDPVDQEFDLVVVGGGMAGTCTAISAARLGVKVALVHNRPVLGGNNSSEVRVHLGARIRLEPYPNLGNLVNEIGPHRGGNAQPREYYEDEKKLEAILAEENISLFMPYHANGVETENGNIVRVVAENIISGEKKSFSAPLFADCTGDGSIGFLAGAEFMSGRESRATFNEPTAPEEADDLTMGISVQWFSSEQDAPSSFPDIAWGLPWSEEKAFAIRRGDWDWETGMGKDMIMETESIRDYGMLVVYSNWSYLKNHYSRKKEFSTEKLQWVAYIGGKRESRRLVGDYILTENDLTDRNILPDGTAPTTWTIDLHYPDSLNMEKYETAPFRSVARHIPIHPYPIPFRCLYSKNVENLMMAGRDISVSHVALGTIRLMRTGGMLGEVLGMAASVCTKHGATPREVYEKHFAEMEGLMRKGVGDSSLPNSQTYNMGGTLMKTK